MQPAPGLLFTAFEPSGDALAAGLIPELRKRLPEVRILGLGGPRMAAAGAELIETTTQRAVMGAGAIAHARLHHQRVKRLAAWLRRHVPPDKLLAHVPTDSPAANWSICKLVRRGFPRAKIVHLAAPQLWAWAPWRVGKLRRLTDHVLCLLPFEPKWFGARGVPATFVGHPLFDVPAQERAKDQAPEGEDWPVRPPRLALLPGSRPGEWTKNWPTMLRAYHALRGKHPNLVGLVAAVDQSGADRLRGESESQRHERLVAEHEWEADSLDRVELAMESEKLPDFGLRFFAAQTDAVLAFSDAVLAVSGTATLQVASHLKPMVALYNVHPLAWHGVGRWLVRTRTFALPNLISESLGHGRAVVEFVPHFGAIEPIVAELDRLLRDEAAREEQRVALRRVCAPFAGVRFAPAAAERLLKVLGE